MKSSATGMWQCLMQTLWMKQIYKWASKPLKLSGTKSRTETQKLRAKAHKPVRCKQIRFGTGFSWSYSLVSRGSRKENHSFNMNLNKTVLIRNLYDLESQLKVLKVLQNMLEARQEEKKRQLTGKIKAKQRMWNLIWEVRAIQFWK